MGPSVSYQDELHDDNYSIVNPHEWTDILFSAVSNDARSYILIKLCTCCHHYQNIQIYLKLYTNITISCDWQFCLGNMIVIPQFKVILTVSEVHFLILNVQYVNMN